MSRQGACAPSRSEMLRYLGYGGQPLAEGLRQAIDRTIGRCRVEVVAAWCYRLFPCAMEGGRLVLDGAAVALPAGWLGEGWREAAAVALLACTLGASFDRRAAQLAATDALDGLLWDAAGSAAVEACADECEGALTVRASIDGLHGGQRVSPGYGRLPLGLSATIVTALSADRLIGLHSSGEGMLLPRKSVTALVPFFHRESQARRARRSCDGCVAIDGCPYRRQGRRCYGP